MTPEEIFPIVTYGVFPAWLLLAVAPGWEWTDRIVHRIYIPCALALVYIWAMFAGPARPEGGNFDTLQGVMLLFTSPHAVLAGWIHYLAFDLFIGAWEVRDAKRRGIPHLWVVPCLFFTLMLGPLGLLMYLGVRFGRMRVTTLGETAA